MKNRQRVLLERFVLHYTGRPLKTFQSVEGSGREAYNIIKPLGAFFKKQTPALIYSTYDPEYEELADQAIEDYVFINQPWYDLPLPVLTVLYERFVQSKLVFISHEKDYLPVTLPPEMGPEGRIKYLTLSRLYQMTLPYPVCGPFVC